MVAEFTARYPFELDGFQSLAIEALAVGESVLVAAPTGSGKTVVGEFAVWLALSEEGKAFYTTPLKALSNQKYSDLAAAYGADKVGLLTGDNSINASAPIVVMTTEVLRNMIYERSDLLTGLRYVILDEVHYLQDRYRGAVWEEVIIHLPMDIKIVSLSATVSNVEEFASWIQTLRGPTTAVIEEKRPIRLNQNYLIGTDLYPMFTGPPNEPDEQVPNAEIMRRERRRQAPAPSGKSRGKSLSRQVLSRRFPNRAEVVELLNGEEMLPAIYFIFSRKGCDMAVSQCVREGIKLTDPSDRASIRQQAELRTAYLPDEDLDVLGYKEWMRALELGVAAHHAGLIPVFKETVEDLFQQGLVRVVFATETLSLGINMPARTVVIESLSKFGGERHELLTPGAFTQLTGRAGRRGIDVLGHAVIPQQRDIPFHQIAGLASTRTFPLVSSFQPSYNMATNLARNYSREKADHLLNSSFAQFHTDKDVVVLERLIDRNDAYLVSYREKLVCHKGDFIEYWRLSQKIADLKRNAAKGLVDAQREQTRLVLASAAVGQVLLIPEGKLAGPVVVIGRDRSKHGESRLFALTGTRRVVRIGPSDFAYAPTQLARLRVPTSNGRDARTLDMQSRKSLASALNEMVLPKQSPPSGRRTDARYTELRDLETQLLEHPCNTCVDREKHGQWAERESRLQKENENLRKRVRARTQTLSRQLDKVLRVLHEFGYIENFSLTPKGSLLSRIYNENDLLVSEVLTRGWLDDLTPAELAAAASLFVFQSRGPFEIGGVLPTASTQRLFSKVTRLAERIQRTESRAGVEMTRGVEAGFAQNVHRWSSGAPLDEVLDETSTPGDFIRSCKQTIDLMRQIAETNFDPLLRDGLMAAAASVNRGVVAYVGQI
ncbi:MAG: DEAD/DEAH box helicase [Actinomycetota bacterium]